MCRAGHDVVRGMMCIVAGHDVVSRHALRIISCTCKIQLARAVAHVWGYAAGSSGTAWAIYCGEPAVIGNAGPMRAAVR